MKPLHLILVLTLPVLSLSACISETAGSAHGGTSTTHSYGSVVTGSLDVVWAATRSTLSRGTDFTADEGARHAEATVSGARVGVTCERYDDAHTILRIGAVRDGQERLDIAESVQIEIQRSLMR